MNRARCACEPVGEVAISERDSLCPQGHQQLRLRRNRTRSVLTPRKPAEHRRQPASMLQVKIRLLTYMVTWFLTLDPSATPPPSAKPKLIQLNCLKEIMHLLICLQMVDFGIQGRIFSWFLSAPHYQIKHALYVSFHP